MTDRAKNIAVLGSTGSIGRSTLEVIAASGGSMRAVVLSAHRSTALLKQQAIALRPQRIVVTDCQAAAAADWSDLPRGVELLVGDEALLAAASDGSIDIVVSAIVGSAGLRSTWAALEAGKTVALANKESLVVGGPLVTRLAARRGARLIPVDSEHSALFQALQAGRREEVRRVVLTASGGPFRHWSLEELARVSVAEALAHPTWNMGPKVTIDSATLMNKALEIVEARWLFDLTAEQIGVVIHPQSIVHSLVEFIDGSVIAQLSPPDMKLPIHYALCWPKRCESVAAKLDWAQAMHWTSRCRTSSDLGRCGSDWRRRGRAGRPGRCSTAPTRRPWPRFWPAHWSSARSFPPAAPSWNITISIPTPAWSACSSWTVGPARRCHVGSVPDRIASSVARSSPGRGASWR